MPVVRWSGIEDTAVAAALVGPRLKRLRESRGITIRQLAARVGVSKNTVLRIEHGLAISEEILVRICDSVQTSLPSLLQPEVIPDGPVRVIRQSERTWRAACRFTDSSVETDERTGVGGSWLTHECAASHGKLYSSTIELLGDQVLVGRRTQGEGFVYCLEGRIELKVGDQTLILNPEDSASFWSRFPHHIRSGLPARSSTRSRLLMVWFEASGDSDDTKCDQGPGD